MTRKQLLTQLADLVRESGNISAACRSLGLDRSVYYREIRTRDAKRDSMAPEARKISSPVVERMLKLCLEYPEWGCDRLAHYLTLTGDAISSPTVQKLLIRHGLGRRAQRDSLRRSSPHSV
jgi:hypothetical protein